MKSIAVLFFAVALAIAFCMSSGAGYLNEVQVIHPEKHAQAMAAAHTAAGNAFVIGVSYDGGTLKVIRAQTRADGVVFGFKVTEYRS